MATNNRPLKAYVRFDGSGRIVAGSLILRKNKPKVGKWQEIPAYECCNYTTTTTTTVAPTTTTSTTVAPTTTSTTTPFPGYYTYQFGAGQSTSSVACAETVSAITVYTIDSPPTVFTTFYTDTDLTLEFDGLSLWYKDIASNNVYRIGVSGNVFGNTIC
jgi:hypothetical protein